MTHLGPSSFVSYKDFVHFWWLTCIECIIFIIQRYEGPFGLSYIRS